VEDVYLMFRRIQPAQPGRASEKTPEKKPEESTEVARAIALAMKSVPA
jgi:hypothetical protein